MATYVADGRSIQTGQAPSSGISGENGYVSPALKTGSMIRHPAGQSFFSYSLYFGHCTCYSGLNL
jgi:hypothetical protein